MTEYDDRLLVEAVNNVSPMLVDGGKKLRGPNATFDFMYQVWVEKALLQTRQIPAMFEIERQQYLKQQKLLQDVSYSGKYTQTSGWSKSREYKLAFSLSRPTYQFLANIVGPLLGYDKSIWADGTRMWRYIKKLIMDGDKTKIAQFAAGIEKRLLKESHKRIIGAVHGNETEGTSTPTASTQDNIQQ